MKNKHKGPKGRIKRPDDYRKTTADDVARGRCETRRHAESEGYTPRMGRSYTHITCPFCERRNKCYLWSLAGCGKRCDCGALHSNYGVTYKRLPDDQLDAEATSG